MVVVSYTAQNGQRMAEVFAMDGAHAAARTFAANCLEVDENSDPFIEVC